MAQFVYYEITGFLPSSFIAHKLGNITKYASEETAIKVLEDVLSKWKSRDTFSSGAEFLSEQICNERYSNYRHQFVFKGKRTGMVFVQTFSVVEHKFNYHE